MLIFASLLRSGSTSLLSTLKTPKIHGNYLITNLLVNGFLQPSLLHHVARGDTGLDLTLRQHLILKIIRVGPDIEFAGYPPGYRIFVDAATLAST